MFVVGRRDRLRRRDATARPRSTLAGLAGSNLEGKELRFGDRRLGAVGGRHDRRLVRRGQRARSSRSPGIGGAVPLANMHDRRGHLRRGRLGPVRDAAVRPAGGVHRRPDGRPHAGVPRQEDRGARDQARRHRRRSPCRCSCSSRPRWPSPRSTARRRSTTPARRASPRRCTPTPRRPTTTARRSPATPASCSPTRRQRRRVRHHLRRPARRRRDARSAASCRWSLALAVAGSLAGKRVAPAGPGTMRTDTPTFVVLLDRRRSCIVALLTFVPALLLGPVVQGLTDRLF